MREGQRGFVEKGRRSLRLGDGHRKDHFRRARGCGYLDLEGQLGRDLAEVPQGGVLRLGDEIKRAKRKGFQSERSAFLGVRADHDDRHAMLARDLAQHFDSVHARHFEIERDDVRMQLFDLAEADQAVHRRADNFDVWVVRERLRNELPHERGIIDHEDADLLAHAIAPTAGIRERCEITAGTFRISTTVPSPRIEAPLTRGDVTS